MIRGILQDLIGLGGVGALIFGVWFEFGWGYASIIGGLVCFALAMWDATRTNQIDSKSLDANARNHIPT
jgi:hypothetical protein